MFPKFDRVHILTSLNDKIIVPQAHLFHVVWRYVYRRAFLDKNNLQYPTDMFIGEDTMFMMQATYWAKSIATAPGAKYHCISVPTSLGKNAKKIMQGRTNGRSYEHQKYSEFMQNSGMKQLLNDIKNGILIKRTRFELFKIPVLTLKHCSNGDITYCLFNIPLLKRRQTHNRIQIFVFGIYVFRKYTKAI